MSGRLFSCACAVLLTATPLLAQHGRSYPTVVGPTGRPYGPTQAEYQYRLQYGHPSPESASQGGTGMEFVNGYPGGGGGGRHSHGFGGPFIYSGFDPFQWYPPDGYTYYPSTAYYGIGYAPGYLLQPVISPPTPPIIQDLNIPADPLANLHPGPSGPAFPSITSPNPVIEPSSPEAQQNSLKFQAQGDEQLHLLNFLAASQRYRNAIDAARDRPQPRYRLAVTLAARSRFLEAVDQFKLSVAVDPTWPSHAERLDDLIGSRNTFEKQRIKTRVAEWTLQDPRDPNRLFLLAVFLHLEGSSESRQLLETAILLSGEQPHLTAFLEAPLPPPADRAVARPNTEPTPADQATQTPIPPLPASPDQLGDGGQIPAPSDDQPRHVPVPPVPPEPRRTGPLLPPLP